MASDAQTRAEIAAVYEIVLQAGWNQEKRGAVRNRVWRLLRGLAGEVQAATQSPGAGGELAERLDAVIADSPGSAIVQLLRDIRATVLTPQAAEDRAVGEWFRSEFEEGRLHSQAALSYESACKFHNRARLAQEQPAPEPDAPTVPLGVAEALRLAGATVTRFDNGRGEQFSRAWVVDIPGLDNHWVYDTEPEYRERWEFVVNVAQRHDNRPTLAEWAGLCFVR